MSVASVHVFDSMLASCRKFMWETDHSRHCLTWTAVIIVANGKTIKKIKGSSWNTQTQFAANTHHSAYFKRKYGGKKLMTWNKRENSEHMRRFLFSLRLHLLLPDITVYTRAFLASNRALCLYTYACCVLIYATVEKILQNLVKRVK